MGSGEPSEGLGEQDCRQRGPSVQRGKVDQSSWSRGCGRDRRLLCGAQGCVGLAYTEAI